MGNSADTTTHSLVTRAAVHRCNRRADFTKLITDLEISLAPVKRYTRRQDRALRNG